MQVSAFSPSLLKKSAIDHQMSINKRSVQTLRVHPISNLVIGIALVVFTGMAIAFWGYKAGIVGGGLSLFLIKSRYGGKIKSRDKIVESTRFPDPGSSSTVARRSCSINREFFMELPVSDEVDPHSIASQSLNEIDKTLSENLVDQLTTTELSNERRVSPFEELEANLPLMSSWKDLDNATNRLRHSYLRQEQVKHRFSDILCPADTAVLGADGHYLHANCVKLGSTSQILSQYPLPDQFTNFWIDVWNRKTLIVDLTRVDEVVPVYYPLTQGSPLLLSSIMVSLTKTSELSHNRLLHEYSVEYRGKTRTLKRIHYLNWIDFGGTVVEDLIVYVLFYASVRPG